MYRRGLCAKHSGMLLVLRNEIRMNGIQNIKLLLFYSIQIILWHPFMLPNFGTEFAQFCFCREPTDNQK